MNQNLKSIGKLGIVAGTFYLAVKAVTVGMPILEAKEDFDAINAENVKFFTPNPPVLGERYSGYLQDLCGSNINAKSIACVFEHAQSNAETHGQPVTLTYTICPTQKAVNGIKEEYRSSDPACIPTQ